MSVGRPKKSEDKAENSRSDRFHSEKKNHIASVAREFARAKNSYTYREIGRVPKLIFFYFKTILFWSKH